ncbi:fungal-specific transcription factor domain-containing protein [Mycena capillaripes]|nr:fungal-specific transcription factor domain-containing protein [Mycena capillaripes]
MSNVEYLGAIYGPNNLAAFRQRRPQRVCDYCRQRKIRCDGPSMADGCCSNCLAFGLSCTYLEPAKKRGPKNTLVEELKKENVALKAKLRSLSICSLCAQPLNSQPREDGPSASVFQHSTPESDTTTSTNPKELPEEQERYTGDELASRFSDFSLDSMKTKYFGMTSTFALAGNALAMKEKYLGKPLLRPSRRPVMWDILPWDIESYAQQPHYVYPAPDLIASLLHLYFTNVHPTIPILHRPSFERSVAEGLHFTDVEFGGALLSVLGVASRYSNDPRVFVDPNEPLSAGAPFIRQIRILRKLFHPTIHEVQMYCLLTLHAIGTSLPQATWLYIGLGIRFLQQRGEHRRRPEGYKSYPEDELWVRAFWSFVMVERMVCVFMGRPEGLHPEDYDVEHPLEVDDEYWDQGFTQPPGKPSQLSFFLSLLRLSEILGDAMRRLYSSKKAKMLLGWDGPEWEQRAVAELDSSMNDILDTIPPHLRWDPENPPEGTFFDQSATLHICYHNILIAIHRPYIKKANVLAAPSLSICANAARAIVRTADIWLTKLQRIPLPNILNPVFVAGIILVLNMLGTKRAGVSMDNHKDHVLIARALDILKFAESRLQTVGRLWELLREVCSLDDPVPPNREPASGDAGTSKIEASESTPTGPSPPNVPFPHPGQSFEAIPGNWDSSLSSDQLHGPAPSISIEQLLADTGTLNSMDVTLDDELMSMWMAAPTDVSHIGQWDAYMENRNINVADINWFNSLGPQSQ